MTLDLLIEHLSYLLVLSTKSTQKIHYHIIVPYAYTVNIFAWVLEETEKIARIHECNKWINTGSWQFHL